MPDAHPMAFKGGTSLSKIYGAINRFSEDVDVTLDYRAFVVRHKQVFFNASYANYEACLANELRLIPGEDAIAELRTDYEKMLGAGMMYGESPSFDDIIAGIREIERKANTW